MGNQGRHFPHVLFAEGFAPGGHSRVAHTGSNGVVKVPLRIVERFHNDLWRRRVHRMFEQAGFVIQTSVTDSAIHVVDLHAIYQVLIARGKRVVDPGRMPIHGRIQSIASDASFKSWWRRVGAGRQQTKLGNHDGRHKRNHNGDDDPEYERTHCASSFSE